MLQTILNYLKRLKYLSTKRPDHVVRIVDRDGNLIVTGVLYRAWPSPQPEPGPMEGVAAIAHGEPFNAPERTAHAVIKLSEPHDMPLWYGGFHKESNLDFSLPSGLHNVWGCGNDFDTDSYRIHPDDISNIMLLIIDGEYHQ